MIKANTRFEIEDLVWVRVENHQCRKDKCSACKGQGKYKEVFICKECEGRGYNFRISYSYKQGRVKSIEVVVKKYTHASMTTTDHHKLHLSSKLKEFKGSRTDIFKEECSVEFKNGETDYFPSEEMHKDKEMLKKILREADA